MEIDQLVEQFGQESGLGNLKLNQDGLCRLVFDDKLFVDIEKTNDNFVFHSVIGKPPVQQDEQFAMMKMLLQANGPEYARKDIRIGIGYDSNMDEFLIFINFGRLKDISFPYFKKCMDLFIKEVGQWQSRLAAAVGTEMPELKASSDESKEKKEEKKKEAPSSKISDPSNIPPGMIKP